MQIQSFSEARTKIINIIESPPLLSNQLVKQEKNIVQHSYTYFANKFGDKVFLNWGLWDETIYNEFSRLNFDYKALCPFQDINSFLLAYHTIRPLLHLNLFGKRIIEIGCGNGVGIKMVAELLQADYALGIDLVKQLAVHSKHAFSAENKLNYLQGDAESLPIDNNSFDVITSIESSHLYSCIQNFFTEVARVLKPGGFFCYTDIHFANKNQDQQFEHFLNGRRDLRIVQRSNIAKMVQSSIYKRLMEQELVFYKSCNVLFGSASYSFIEDSAHLAAGMGANFLPFWKKRPKTLFLKEVMKRANVIRHKGAFGRRKNYFYYLIQKLPTHSMR